MSVLAHDTEREVTRTDDERGSYEIAVDGVSACSTSGLDFNHDSEIIMHGVDFVRHDFGSVVAEQNGSADAFSRTLASLDGVAELYESGSDVVENGIAR